MWTNFGSPFQAAKPTIPGFNCQLGDKVAHPKFGQGVVVGIRGDGPDAEISVAFPGAMRKLMAQYANLQKL